MYAFDTNLGHADLFVCTGGASAGTRDLLPDVIGAMGEVDDRQGRDAAGHAADPRPDRRDAR